MATSKELAAYIARNAEQLNLKIKNLRWPERMGQSFSDIQSTITIEGREHEGRGSDLDADTALIKSFVEAFERSLIYRYSFPSTNGLAGHTDSSIAYSNAINEALERHIFFEFFRNERGFPTLHKEDHTAFVNESIRSLNDQNIEVKALSLDCSTQGVFTLVIFDGRKSKKGYGIIIGTALASTSNSSQNHAMIEALRYHWFVSDHDNVLPITIDDFKALKEPKLSDNGRLGLDIEYASWFMQTFTSTSFREIVVPEITVEKISLREDDPPLVFYRAIINGGNDINLSMLSKTGMPHPFR